MRAKWSAPIRKYWKISEQMMVKYCDLAICDSVNIKSGKINCIIVKDLSRLGRNYIEMGKYLEQIFPMIP